MTESATPKSPSGRAGRTAPAGALADNIRRLRTLRGMTLVQLAARTGISRATLSRLERGDNAPSALVLGKLATGLEASLSQLLGRQDIRRPVLVKPAEQPVFIDPDSGLHRRSITPSFADRSLDLALNHLPPGGVVTFPAHQPGVEEYLHVLKGRLHVTTGDTDVDVEAGSTLFYPGDKTHVFANREREPCDFLIMIDSRPVP